MSQWGAIKSSESWVVRGDSGGLGSRWAVAGQLLGSRWAVAGQSLATNNFASTNWATGRCAVKSWQLQHFLASCFCYPVFIHHFMRLHLHWKWICLGIFFCMPFRFSFCFSALEFPTHFFKPWSWWCCLSPWQFPIITQIGSRCWRRFHLWLNKLYQIVSSWVSHCLFVSERLWCLVFGSSGFVSFLLLPLSCGMGRLLSFCKPLTLELPNSYNIVNVPQGRLSISAASFPWRWDVAVQSLSRSIQWGPTVSPTVSLTSSPGLPAFAALPPPHLQYHPLYLALCTLWPPT